MANPGELPPGQIPIKQPLRWGIEHAGIVKENPRIDLKTYVLAIEGEIGKPSKLNWQEILTLPKIEATSDFHCVEGWSVLNCRWEGISFKEIVHLVIPKKEARFVSFECADGYTTSLTLDELLDGDALLTYRLNGKPLEEGYGFPLRLVVSGKYAYKNAMWLTRIIFTSKKKLGYWEKRGYSDTADVQKNDRFSK